MTADSIKDVIVHVMPKEKFTFAFIEFTFESFPDNNIMFIVYGDDDSQGYIPYVSARVVPVNSSKEVFRSKKAVGLLESASVVILNWVNMSMLPSMWRYLPKTYFLFWGGDFAPYYSGGNLCLTERAKRALLSKSINRARGFMALLPIDLERLSSFLSAEKESYQVDISSMPHRTLAGVDIVRKRTQSPIKILVGNSATQSNRHLAVLDLLSKFDKEDIELYVPLSYGDEHYRDEVIAYGAKRFEKKFIPVIDYMNPAEYTNFLSDMSIGVFNHDRQQGLGNIRKLLRMGSKVYISSDSGMLNDLRANGSYIYLTEDIQHLSFSEFSNIDEAEAEKNKIANSVEQRYQQAVTRWRVFYDHCIETVTNHG